jgi:hypothetical protein
VAAQLIAERREPLGSEYSTAVQFLRGLQEYAGSDPRNAIAFGVSPTTACELKDIDRHVQAELRRSFEQWPAEAQEGYTAALAMPADEPAHRAVVVGDDEALSRHVEDIEGVLSEGHLLRKPILGMLWARTPSAATIQVPGTAQSVVALDSDTFIMTNLLSKALVQAFPLGDKETFGDTEAFATAIEQNLLDRPEAKQRMSELLLNYGMHGTAAAARPYLLDYESMRRAYYTTRGMQLFAVAHEYGHLRAHELALRPADGAGQIIWSWAQELYADTLGGATAITALRQDGYDTGLAFASVDIYFTGLWLLERARELFRHLEYEQERKLGQRIVHSTHPPAALRRRAFRQAWTAGAYANFGSEKGAQYCADGLLFADRINQTLVTLWTAIEESLQDIAITRVIDAMRSSTEESRD